MVYGMKKKNFIEVMEGLIRFCTEKHINLRPGLQASTNGKDTIWLPWLRNDATKEDFIKFFNFASHEQSRFDGDSKGHGYSRNRTIKFLQNAVEDIRCESLQEKKYPGLGVRRLDFYKVMTPLINPDFEHATKANITKFVTSLGKLLIIKIRTKQLNLDLEVTPSDELIKAYTRYFADLEDEIQTLYSCEKAFDMGQRLYDRLKDMIKEEMEKKTPPPTPPTPEDDDTDDDTSDGKRSETPKEEYSESEDEDENSEQREEPEERTDDDRGNPDSSGDPEDSEDESSGEDEDKSSERSVDEDQPEEPSESLDQREDDQSSGAHDDDESPEDDPEDGIDDESPEDDPEDGVDDESPDENEPDSSDENENDEPDPMAEHEKAMLEHAEKIERAVLKMLEDIEDELPEDTSIIDVLKKNIDEIAAREPTPYMVHPSVKDVIKYKEEGSELNAHATKERGIKLLGTSGSKMTKLFVGLSRPRTVRNREEGRFDARTYISDPLDKRKDFYTQKKGALLDKAAVAIMMDNSASMYKVIDITYALLSGLHHYLNKARIPSESVGFTAKNCNNPEYRDKPVYLQIIKKFEDPWNAKAQRRCVPPKYMDQNAEVDCLRWMVPRLWARPEKKKILFIIGDGLPHIGHKMLNKKLSIAYKEYVELCRKAGIIVFGFGINCNLSWIFGNDYQDITEGNMADILVGKLKEILNRRKTIRLAA